VKWLPAFAVSCLLICAAPCEAAGSEGASIARAIQQAGLDPDQCYRVRDFAFQKEDLKFYLNDGHLLFARAVDGRRLAAVFVADVPGGDAEVMLFPPHTSERLALSLFTKSPNLNEHFIAAVFLFTDNTGADWLEQLKDSKKDPSAALVIGEQFNTVVANIAQSFEIRLVHDMLASDFARNGMFFAAISGKNLGNFDVIVDPRAQDQILVGQLASRDNRRYFDIWTSFASRSVRNGSRPRPESQVTAENFTIDATLTPELLLKAKTTVEITTKSSTGRALNFDLSRHMNVTDVRVDGEPAEFFVRESLRSNVIRSTENDSFLIILPQPLQVGQKRKIEISHEGNVIAAAGKKVFYVGARSNWYPSPENSFATYDLTFRYPRALQLVSTGSVVEDRTEDTWRITRHKVDSPIRFAGFNLGDYEKASVTRAGFTIEVYANRVIEAALQPRPREILPAPSQVGIPRLGRSRTVEGLDIPSLAPPLDPKARLRALADEIGMDMEYMSATFGPPALRTLTVSPIPGAFGQGFPGLLYLSTLSYLNPNDLPSPMRGESQKRFFSELLHAHEAAHQWWGNLVTSASYQDDWLMEALANYSALMLLEKKKGRRAMEEVLDEYRVHLLAETPEKKTLESAGPIVWGSRLNSSQTGSSWRAIMYEKGAWIIHMLRVRMGDASFTKMLNALAQRNRYKRVSTDDFRKLAAEFMPRAADDSKLENFFEQWVYGTGIPSLKLSHSIRGKAPRVHVQGAIAQSDVDEEFSVTIPVEILLPGKRSVTKWVRTSSDPATFAADLPQAPLKLQIDPYAVLMKR
jgi:hypothetical protein